MVPPELSFSDRWSRRLWNDIEKNLRIAGFFAPLNFKYLSLELNIDLEIVPFSAPVAVAMIYLLPTLFYYFITLVSLYEYATKYINLS